MRACVISLGLFLGLTIVGCGDDGGGKSDTEGETETDSGTDTTGAATDSATSGPATTASGSDSNSGSSTTTTTSASDSDSDSDTSTSTGGTSDGTGGSATTGATTGDTGGGGAYDDCEQGECSGSDECLQSGGGGGGGGSVCGAECESHADCPAAPSGNATPECVDIPDGSGETMDLHCVLDCLELGQDLDCPDGMECGTIEVVNEFGDGTMPKAACVWP